MKRVNIKISNKAVYSLLAIFIIAAVAVSVFAALPSSAPNPGHLASEIASVCRTDGVGCEGLQNNLNLYIRSSDGLLCYPTAEASSCTTGPELCSYSEAGYQISDMGACDLSASVQDTICNFACKDIVACEGDTTNFGCGDTGTIKYASGTADGCQIYEGEHLVDCLCSVSENYQKETANNERCI